MARSTSPRPATKGLAPSSAPAESQPANAPVKRESFRETAEAVVIAFIIALLVRGFEFEAFVIPTGSMAPTLMGRHKEVTCPQCGYVYSVNAWEEQDDYGGRVTPRRVTSGICVNCRYQAKLDETPSFNGDRILVMKFPYELPNLPGSSGPKRWDVVVFHYPEDPEISYIKRLVGLPGETLKIWYGDVFLKPPGGTAFAQARKPLAHQQAMQMTVYDDRHRPVALNDHPEWQRWTPAAPGAWTETAGKPGTFAAAPSGESWSELTYRNLIPDPAQWQAVVAGDPLPYAPKPSLITDFYSYNTNLNAENSDLTGHVSRDQEGAWLQPHWVGDLTVSAHLVTDSTSGSFRIELIEGGVPNRCEIDLATGEAVIRHGGTILGRGPTAVKGAGAHDLTFANVDNRLTLWVDGHPAFGEGLTYEDGPDAHPVPTTDDLSPVRLATKQATLRVSELVLKRDIYYTLSPGRPDYAGGNVFDERMPKTPAQLFDLLSDPKRVAAFMPLGSVEYLIHEGHYLMLGDNSPRSKDSRGWETKDRYMAGDPAEGIPSLGWDPSGRQAWEVPRGLLTGKAFCIYWPHGVPFGPQFRLGNDLRIPFRPYVERMHLIH